MPIQADREATRIDYIELRNVHLGEAIWRIWIRDAETVADHLGRQRFPRGRRTNRCGRRLR